MITFKLTYQFFPVKHDYYSDEQRQPSHLNIEQSFAAIHFQQYYFVPIDKECEQQNKLHVVFNIDHIPYLITYPIAHNRHYDHKILHHYKE